MARVGKMEVKKEKEEEKRVLITVVCDISKIIIGS